MFLLAECIGVAAFSCAAWFGVILWIDPHRREKGSAGTLFITLLIGFASIPLVILLYEIVPDPRTTDQAPGAQWFIYNMLVTGPVEEFAKFAIFFLATLRRRAIQEPLDAMLHAAAVALAFATVENVQYGVRYGVEIAALRALLSTPGHLVFACIWGFAYAVLIYTNARRRARDFVILFFSIFPAAVIHGLSNVLLHVIEDWALLVDVAEFVGATSLVLWLQRKSPYRPFRLADARQAVQRIELSLGSNANNFSLNLRAALARAALGDYARARGHIDRCLRLRKGDAFTIALSGVINVLQGRTAEGEEALHFSFSSLSAGQKRTLGRLTRHVASTNRTENAYNEFHLSMWMKNHGRARASTRSSRRR
jgi:RsiW-degrading membrane proteinase PrsW (M82 family)